MDVGQLHRSAIEARKRGRTAGVTGPLGHARRPDGPRPRARFDTCSGGLGELASFAPRYVRRTMETIVTRRSRRGPGLAKTTRHRFIVSRQLQVWQSSDHGWQELFEAADVMSEGAVRRDRDGSTYYGTTSLLLPYRSRGGLLPDHLAADVMRLLSRDLHARVRAIRIACREAQVRCDDPLGRIRAEFVVRPDARGVRLDVEVEAQVLEAARRPAARR